MKRKLFYLMIIAIGYTFQSCTKSDAISTSKPLSARTIIAEKYNFNGTEYTLNFYDDNTDGVPINTSTEDALIAAIGTTIYNQVYYDTDPDVTYLEPENTTSSGTQSNLAAFAPEVCLFAEYFEHSNFGGSSFCVDDKFGDHVGLYQVGQLVSEFFGEADLSARSLGMSGNWEDKISSFRMYGSGPSKAWYIDHGYASGTAKATFTLYRGKDYETGTCRYNKWVMSLPYNSTNTWNVSGLSKEKWRGLLCANMNDKTSSLGVIFCKNSVCFEP